MCVNIPIVNDDIPEGDERFSVTLTSNHLQVRIRSFLEGTATITICDDDGELELDSVHLVSHYC